MVESHEKDTGGRAFDRTTALGLVEFGNLTVRDWFAGQALVSLSEGVAFSDKEPGDWEAHVAKLCYRLSDAMLAERSK